MQALREMLERKLAGPILTAKVLSRSGQTRPCRVTRELNTAMNHSIIGGRDMIRPGLGAGAIGGPAKNVAGVIGGNSFRPRHP